MEYGYVIKLSSRKVYKEIQLPVDSEMMRIGTDITCDVRLYKEDFFEAFQLDLSRKDKDWQLICSENIYIDAGDVRKLVSKVLNHGDMFAIKYHGSDQEVFKAEFLYDFDNSNKNYDRVIDISGISVITVGSAADNNIVLNSQYVKNDSIAFQNRSDRLLLLINQCNCGVYHNGRKAADKEMIHNGDFVSVADFSFYYKDGRLMTEATGKVRPNVTFSDNRRNPAYPKFNRNTRIKSSIDTEKIEVLDPPAKPQKPKNNLFTRLLPSVAMITVGAATAMTNPFMLISSGVGIITAIISVVQSKKDFKDNSAERIEKYNTYIANKRSEIEALRAKEKEKLESIYISPETEERYFEEFSADLFDRAADDEDFLVVRVGLGDVEAKKEINYKKQERLEVEDDLQEKPKQLYDEYKYISSCPVTCDLKETNAIGIFGQRGHRFNIMKNFVIDICARQFQSDVRMFFVAEKENKNKVHWLRMLPHVFNDVIGVKNIVCDDESKNIIFEYLYKELTIREQAKKHEPRFIVFLHDEYGFKNHPISKFVEKAKDLGVTFIFFGDEKSDIALGCDYLIDVKDSENAVLINTADESKSTDFKYTVFTDAQARQIVDMMAPVYTEEISLEGTLTRNISLFKLLNILTVEDIDLSSNWNASQVYKSMAAPLGVSKSGIITLDLHDKAHGPHGLVAGTTGSGKSEILQTYILSMAILYHPYEVGFVIIDFKGGGMVNQFRDLPHLIGAITNIDGKEIDRSLKSIKAELQKRQRLFAEADVNHIDKYIRKYKAGEAEAPLPHLILIVDEFAELKAEQPDFMKELISAARIGRSLGVHLILATQKPSGQVDDQIWSNSRFKLCLKVQDQQDSNEVLKSPLAAEIKEPGRAYLQVGNNEVFELFQSAYSGAAEKGDNSSFKEFSVYAITDSGRRVPVYIQKKKKSDEENRSQLDAIVDYVQDYVIANDIPRLPDICLPSLEPVIEYCSYDIGEFSVPVGIYDDPDNQLQAPFGINIFSDNALIVGSSMSGKTNFLQLIIRGIASKYSPGEVTIYAIDFASMVLKNFEKLNHVGGVVVSNEDEKLKNLFKLLSEEIETRKEKLLSAGVSSFIAYKEAGNEDLPQIVLIVDNLTALKELYFSEEDMLLPICRDGISVGVSVILANPQTSGVGFKYFSNINQRIGLPCNDSSEYHTIFDHCRMQPDNNPGRCLVQRDKSIYEAQTFLAFSGEKEFERAQEVEIFIDKINRKYSAKAKKIPVIPEFLFENMILEEFGVRTDKDRLLLGLNFADVSPVSIDLSRQDIIAVSGGHSDSRQNFNNLLKASLLAIEAEIYILDDYSGIFEDISNEENVLLYSRDIEDISEMLDGIRAVLVERYAEREISGVSALKEMNPLVFIINSVDAAGYISEHQPLLETYKEILKKHKNLKSLIIFTNIENDTISYSSPEVLKMMKDNNQFIVFDDLSNVKLFDCPMSLLRKFKNPVKENEAYFLSGNVLKKVKVISKR